MRQFSLTNLLYYICNNIYNIFIYIHHQNPSQPWASLIGKANLSFRARHVGRVLPMPECPSRGTPLAPAAAASANQVYRPSSARTVTPTVTVTAAAVTTTRQILRGAPCSVWVTTALGVSSASVSLNFPNPLHIFPFVRVSIHACVRALPTHSLVESSYMIYIFIYRYLRSRSAV